MEDFVSLVKLMGPTGASIVVILLVVMGVILKAKKATYRRYYLENKEVEKVHRFIVGECHMVTGGD